jgi:hypothetical protein
VRTQAPRPSAILVEGEPGEGRSLVFGECWGVIISGPLGGYQQFATSIAVDLWLFAGGAL